MSPLPLLKSRKKTEERRVPSFFFGRSAPPVANEDDEDDDDGEYRSIFRREECDIKPAHILRARMRNIAANRRWEKFEQSMHTQRMEKISNITALICKIRDKKSEPVDPAILPVHPSWDNEQEFNRAVLERMEMLIRSDAKRGRTATVKRAENLLDGVRDTHDRKMCEVYERLVYEIKNTSGYMYAQLKKLYFGN